MRQAAKAFLFSLNAAPPCAPALIQVSRMLSVGHTQMTYEERRLTALFSEVCTYQELWELWRALGSHCEVLP